MHFAHGLLGERPALLAPDGDGWRVLAAGDAGWPGTLPTLYGLSEAELGPIAARLAGAPRVEGSAVRFLAPVGPAARILCIGLNYAAHTAETDWQQPEHPTVFGRWPSSLTGHLAPLLLPRISRALDFEGELAVVIGRRARHLRASEALGCVFGYTVFNDGSVRDVQRRTTQWTLGKNFDASGAAGPVVTTAGALPRGARGLALETRVSGEVMQRGNTADLIFDVATLLATISSVLTLEPGDVVATGTPAGVGFTRDPPRFLAAGEVCEVEIEGIGRLVNPVAAE